MKKGAKLGPLHGVPFSTKDLVITRGIRTTFGTRLFADNVPAEDAPMVERMQAAGAIQLGKTNTPMLGWIGATHNLLFGATRNPWNLDRTPGGSSGGASAAVAAGHGPARHRHRRRRLDPHPGLAGRHLRHQAHVRPRADLSVQRRVGALAHRAHDPHGGGRRADAERVRGARRARSLLAAGPARGLRQGAQGRREGAARGVDRRSRLRQGRRSRGEGGLRARGAAVPRAGLPRGGGLAPVAEPAGGVADHVPGRHRRPPRSRAARSTRRHRSRAWSRSPTRPRAGAPPSSSRPGSTASPGRSTRAGSSSATTCC